METQANLTPATYAAPDTLKANIVEALRAFIRQRPGVDPRNYFDPSDPWNHQGRAAYNTERRSISNDLKVAETLLKAVERSHGLTGKNLIDAAFVAFSGRLSIKDTGLVIKIGYTTGQYYPTEYRRAVAAVCASALWDYVRENSMPRPVYFVEWQNERGEYVRVNNHLIRDPKEAEALADSVRKQKEKERAAFATPPHGYGYTTIREAYRTPKGYISGGDWLRAYFRREFGRGIASRFFN